jgi:hypothetical protein
MKKLKARKLKKIVKFPLWEYSCCFYAKNDKEADATVDRFDTVLCNHKGPDKKGRGCYLVVATSHPVEGWVDGEVKTFRKAVEGILDIIQRFDDEGQAINAIRDIASGLRSDWE